MSKIRVYYDERKGENFPPACVRCGRESVSTVRQKFSWVPPWVLVIILAGLLPWLIVTLILRKSMPVTLPVCSRHLGHWRNRTLFVWLGLFFWIVYSITLAAEWSDLPKDGASAALGILIFGGLIWLIAAAIYSNSAIRPARITDDYVELVGVDKTFAKAWDELADEEPKPKKRRRLDE